MPERPPDLVLLNELHDTAHPLWFVADERFRIGRDKANDLVTHDPTVSRFHTSLRLVGSDIVVEDLGTANGTILNGKRVNRGLLRLGDRLNTARVSYLAVPGSWFTQELPGDLFVEPSAQAVSLDVVDDEAWTALFLRCARRRCRGSSSPRGVSQVAT